MADKIKLTDIVDFTLEEVQEFRREIDKLIYKCEKLKKLGIIIEGKNLQELTILLKDNKA